MIKEILIYILLPVLLMSCGESLSNKSPVEKKIAKKNEAKDQSKINSLPYEVNKPKFIYELPKALTEISGLTFSTLTKRLLAINDEEGIVYALDPLSGTVIDKIKFGKADDYEGIASHDGYLYIAESNGNIKVVKEDSKTKIIEFNDRLSSANDIEGICYNPMTKTLLLAAKGASATEGNTKSVKSIFTMNIDNGAIRKQPYLEVNMKESYQSLYHNEDTGILNAMTSSSKFRKYGPSGIAICPRSNLIYLLSSNSKSLAVLDHDGNILSVTMLDQKIHAQPEGITFDEDANLYISNEGKKGVAILYKYKRVIE